MTSTACGDDSTFASDDEVPKRKRLRVSQACDQCRKRKERCDGGQPACVSCDKTGRQCSYNPVRKRGLPTGYVRSIEVLLGALIRSSDDADILLASLLRGDRPLLCNTASPHGLEGAGSLLDAWRKSLALKELETILVAAETEEDDEAISQRLDSRLTLAFNSNIDRLRDASRIVSGSAAAPPGESILPTHGIAPPIPEIQPAYESSIVAEAEDPFPRIALPPRLPSNWVQLIDIYINNTHAWLPITQKHTLLRSASLLSEKDSPGPGDLSLRPGDRASLWAVLAFASYQTGVLGDGDKDSSRPDDSGLCPLFGRLYTEAKHLALDGLAEYDPGHIHANLVLALLAVGRSSWAEAWTLVGRAVLIAVDLGIVPPPRQQNTTTLDDGSKRLFLGCFVLESLIASRLERRPYLRRAEYERVGNLEVDNLEEWEGRRYATATPAGTQSNAPVYAPGRILSTFNKFSRLAATLNDAAWLSTEDAHGEDHLRRRIAVELEDCWIQDEITPEAKESPQSVNLAVASASVYMALRGRGFPRCHTSPRPECLSFRILNLLQSISNRALVFGETWLPPVFDTYLYLFCHSSAALPSSATAENWKHAIARLQESFERTWPKRTQIENVVACKQTQHMSHVSRAQTRRRCSSYSGAKILKGPDNSHESKQTTFVTAPQTCTPPQTSTKGPEAPKRPEESGGIPPALPDVGILGDGLWSEPVTLPATSVNNDELFNRIAVLDAAEWFVIPSTPT